MTALPANALEMTASFVVISKFSGWHLRQGNKVIYSVALVKKPPADI